MIVREAMTPDPVIIHPDASVSEAARLMKSNAIGSLIVVADDRMIGIITERDLVRRVLATDKQPGEVAVRSILSSPVITISPREDVTAAAKLMKEKGIRRLVVMEGERLVGIITNDDLSSNLMRVVEEFATTLFVMERRKDFDQEYIRRYLRS